VQVSARLHDRDRVLRPAHGGGAKGGPKLQSAPTDTSSSAARQREQPARLTLFIHEAVRIELMGGRRALALRNILVSTQSVRVAAGATAHRHATLSRFCRVCHRFATKPLTATFDAGGGCPATAA